MPSIRSISLIVLTFLLTAGGRVWAQAYGVQWVADAEFSNALNSSSEVLPRPIHFRYIYEADLDGFKDSLKNVAAKTADGTEADVFVNIISHGQRGALLTAYTQPMNGLKYPGPWIAYEEIAQAIVDLANSNHNLTVNVNLIACYSGSFLPILKQALEKLTAPESKRTSLFRKFFRTPAKPRINVMVSTDGDTPSENAWGTVIFDSELVQAQAQIKRLKEKFPGLFTERTDYEWIQKIIGLGPRFTYNHPRINKPLDRYSAWSSYREDFDVWTNEQLIAILATDLIPNDRQPKILARLQAQGFDLASHPVTRALTNSCEAALVGN